MENLRARIYVDGACSHNPGPMAIGVSVCNQMGQEFDSISQLLPDPGTSVIAEYEALLAGLEYVIENGYSHVEAFSDSQLIVYQVNGDRDCNAPHLRVRLDRARALIRQLSCFTIRWWQPPKGDKGKDASRPHELAAQALATPAGREAKRQRGEQVSFRPGPNGTNKICPIA